MKFSPSSRLSEDNPIKSHEFQSHPDSKLLVDVFIHPSDKCMNVLYHHKYPDGDDVRAFCESSKLGDDDRITARLHFARETVTASLIAHEAFHATVCCLHHHKLNVSDTTEEFLAETIGHIVNEVMKLCAHLKIKVAPVNNW